LQVTATGGRTFVVTVDDAPTGAALLNTLAACPNDPLTPTPRPTEAAGRTAKSALPTGGVDVMW